MKYKGPKGTAWKYFSLYIRLRDCVETTGHREWGKCITCGKTFNFKELQCGHAIGGRGNSILLDEDLCSAQCYACNICRNGEHGRFALKLIDKYDREWYEEALIRSKQPKPMKKSDWEEQAVFWKKKYEGLLSVT